MAISRNQFEEMKNWSEPQWQEGVPVMDADLNLAAKINKNNLRRAVCDFLGNGSPNDGFKLSGTSTDPTINAGNIWIAGLKIELPEDLQASEQPNAPVSFPAGNGIWYLDIIEVLLSNADDPDIRDSRLPSNVETPVKVWKTDWVLRKVLGSQIPSPEAEHYHIGITSENAGAFSDIRNSGIIIAGEDTGYHDRTGTRPGGGHKHHDEDIDVNSLNYTGTRLDTVLDEIDSRIDSVGGSVINDHGTLRGLGDDDHTQYLNTSRHSSVHTASFNNSLPVSGDVGGAATLGAHISNTGIHGSGAWKSPVQSLSNLPATGNTDKDARLVEDENSIYRWDSGSSQWYKTGNAGVGITDHEDLSGIQGGASNDHSHITSVEYTQHEAMKRLFGNLPYLFHLPYEGTYLASCCVFANIFHYYDAPSPDYPGYVGHYCNYTSPAYCSAGIRGIPVGNGQADPYSEPRQIFDLGINGTKRIDGILCSKAGKHFTFLFASDNVGTETGAMTALMLADGFTIETTITQVFVAGGLGGDYRFNLGNINANTNIAGGDGAFGTRVLGSPIHNLNRAIQGGVFSERYHLTAEEHANVPNIGKVLCTDADTVAGTLMDSTGGSDGITQLLHNPGGAEWIDFYLTPNGHGNDKHSAAYLDASAHSSSNHTGISGVGITDHGAATGLGDDDHTQYLNGARHSAISGNAHGATHDQLASVDSGTYRHLSATQVTDLTDGGATILHTHTNIGGVSKFVGGAFNKSHQYGNGASLVSDATGIDMLTGSITSGIQVTIPANTVTTGLKVTLKAAYVIYDFSNGGGEVNVPILIKINNVDYDLGAASNFVYKLYTGHTSSVGGNHQNTLEGTFIITQAMMTAVNNAWAGKFDVTKEMKVYGGYVTSAGYSVAGITGVYMTVESF